VGGDRPNPATKTVSFKDVSELAAIPTFEHSPSRHFGHQSYSEASQTQLMVVSSYSKNLEQRFERLRSDAALALMQLVDAARAEGVWIVPVSGFRDLVRQEMLYTARIQELGSEELAARSVAPPGYSEHHTGYAIDLADGLARARDISISFVQTEAFAWLTAHAEEFGFELSFPRDNEQGVNFEPWHWRYVGSPQAAALFAQGD
jgi:LAS superfamily LD-carboxypeptidase LdcB